MKIAVFPGSFDPVTKGHQSIVQRALPLFDQIVVAVGVNADKTSYFPLEQKIAWLKCVFAGIEKVRVESYNGLTVDFCKRLNAGYIIRGLRTSADFEFERSVAQVNLKLEPGIETVFLLTHPDYVMVTSSIVREVHKNGGDVSQFVPDCIKI